MIGTLRRLLLHPWLTVRCQIALGLVFAVAALSKIVDPPGFAKAIWNYQLFPAWSVHPIALALPWLELLCGLALCLGLWVRAATSWLLVLLLGFTVALSINLARHHPVDCGCFHLGGPPRTEAERLVDLRWAILRDLGLILLAGQILAASRKAE
jgi:putative oxidoreductase